MNRNETARMLAYQVLSEQDDIKTAAGRAGNARVDLEIQGITQTIRRQIYVEHAAIAASITKQITDQTGALNLDEIIAKQVAAELRAQVDMLKERISDVVRVAIQRRTNAITERLTRQFLKSRGML